MQNRGWEANYPEQDSLLATCLSKGSLLAPPLPSILLLPVHPPTQPYPNPFPPNPCIPFPTPSLASPSPTHPNLPPSIPTSPIPTPILPSLHTSTSLHQYHIWSAIFDHSDSTKANWYILQIDNNEKKCCSIIASSSNHLGLYLGSKTFHICGLDANKVERKPFKGF